MDRLEEIRQHCEYDRLIRHIDIKYLLSEVAELTELLNASKAGQLTLQKAWEQDKDELTARAEAAEAERDAAVEDLKLALIDETLDPCHCCEYGRTNHCTHPDGPTCGETGGKNWQWRGQRAGKEGNNAEK